MRIERLERSRHKKGRILLFLEGGELLKATEQELLEFDLRAGRELTEEELSALRRSAGVSDAKARAAELIGSRAMSRRDLMRKLREKGATEAEARYAAEWLEAIGAMDDGAYAAMVVRHYAAMGYGPSRLRDKLYEKGVPRELWDAALEEAPPEEEQIDAFLHQKLRGQAPDEREKKRLSDALVRRGYSWDQVRSAFVRLGAEIEEE
ncbi:recombination regulator RecX [Oscillibacter sp. MSJ-2]|uniref:Regulatory protein RecX n=1 Tax=Dysosmobacter acutus TaxID=2841504 RepID=A0ABS6F805_9FIRM|nr:regulatory protein RecX [Dysosmobacter acutus]MBU5626292.1 recombination regulator RecX [Dysosmobacter acutus]